MRNRTPLFKLTITALLLAANVALSSFGVSVPGGHLYLNDIVIVMAGILLDPLHAFVVGGLGSFLGDLIFYPTPMFVSLAVHGLQAVVISLLAHKENDNKQKLHTLLGVVIGAVIMVVGYSLGRAYIYSTPEYAMLKLPFQIFQATVGAIFGFALSYQCGIRDLYLKFENKKSA